MKLNNNPHSFQLISIILLIGFIVSMGFSTFYENSERDVYIKVENDSDWLKVKSDVKISKRDVVITYKSQLGLSKFDELIEMRSDVDQKGNVHSRYQHYHKGFKVEGSQLLVHQKDGLVYLVNGTVVKELDQEISAFISKKSSIEIGISAVPAVRYMWENEDAEKLLKRVRKNERASYYPDPSLVFVNSKYDQNSSEYELAYDVLVHSMMPMKRERLFVSAKTGEIIFKFNELHTESVHGTAVTRYHGVREIITDSIAPDHYRLVDTTRGAGIETYNAEQGINISTAVDFEDEDNYWDNANENKDEVAGDVHWGAEMTFDFYGTLGQFGLNGDTLPFISFVHVGQEWTNATWDGTVARFGDAESPDQPLASIDVVGHEFTHGLTDFTADLVYMNESGALNESFSDIFGTAIEFYADSATADWFVGEDFIASGGFRNMEDPQSFSDPDTYKGSFWVTGSGDNGGVHTNSSVQNYWFYLLTDGGEGINDNVDIYNIKGLGIDSTIRIAYSNLKYYLLVNSQFEDARIGAIQSAIDLYGECSEAVKQTTDAWFAVGVGKLFPRTDFEILDIIGPDSLTCGVTNQEQVSMLMRYNDCDVSLAIGTKIPTFYQVDDGDFVMDTITLTEEILSGDSLVFTFVEPIADFVNPGSYELSVGVNYIDDNDQSNNIFRQVFKRIYDQNTDMALNEVVSPSSGCYLGMEELVLAISFEGCDSIQAGESMSVQYRVDGGVWEGIDYTLEDVLYRGDEIFVSLPDSVDLSNITDYLIDARILYEADTLEVNNVINDVLIENPNALQYKVKMTFEGDLVSSLDSFFVRPALKSTIEVVDSAGFMLTRGIRIAGTDGLKQLEDDKIVIPKFANVWDINEAYRKQVCFCADLTQTIEARLKFRIQQTYSPIYNDLYGKDHPYASSARLLLNGEQFGGTFIANNSEGSHYFLKNFDIEEYTGGQLEICIETATLTSVEDDPYGVGDQVHIDEVVLVSEIYVGLEELDNDEFLVYPNPFSDELRIEFKDDYSKNREITIFDVQGSQIFVKELRAHQKDLKLNLSQINSGIYFVKMTSEDQVFIQKMVKD